MLREKCSCSTTENFKHKTLKFTEKGYKSGLLNKYISTVENYVEMECKRKVFHEQRVMALK